MINYVWVGPLVRAGWCVERAEARISSQNNCLFQDPVKYSDLWTLIWWFIWILLVLHYSLLVKWMNIIIWWNSLFFLTFLPSLADAKNQIFDSQAVRWFSNIFSKPRFKCQWCPSSLLIFFWYIQLVLSGEEMRSQTAILPTKLSDQISQVLGGGSHMFAPARFYLALQRYPPTVWHGPWKRHQKE